MHTFYVPEIPESNLTLPEVESKHAIKVLRLKQGDSIRLVDGKGTEATGTIGNSHPKHTEVEIQQRKTEERAQFEISIALAPTKSNDRTEWFLEKAIEIGITQFIPIICKNSERKKFNPSRWDKIAVSALKQSRRLWLPEILPPTPVSEVFQMEIPGLKWIAHCEEEHKNELAQCINSNENQIILIGPEGDFSTEEITQALENGFAPVSLGDNRLRTETAGVVAATLMKFG